MIKIFPENNEIIFREKYFVSPYYPSSGGTVIDWVPADFADDEQGMD